MSLDELKDRILAQILAQAEVREHLASDYPEDGQDENCGSALRALAHYVSGIPADDPPLQQLLRAGEESTPQAAERARLLLARYGFGVGTPAPAPFLQAYLRALTEVDD